MNNISYRLSTVVAAAICSMVIFTAFALGGVFSYSYIKSLKSEFYDRVRAEGDEQSLKIYSFLHQAKSRLQELGRDNSIRVTMMLGVDYPLSEKLAEYNQIPLGVDYFIQRKGSDKIFSSTAKVYDEILVRKALKKAPYSCSLCLNSDEQVATVFSIPIRSRSEVVGSAACIVDVSGIRLGHQDEGGVGSRVILFDQGRVYDLFKGGSLEMSMGPSLGMNMFEAVLGKDQKGVLFRSSLVPGLAYFVSHERLETSLYRTFWLIMPFFWR